MTLTSNCPVKTILSDTERAWSILLCVTNFIKIAQQIKTLKLWAVMEENSICVGVESIFQNLLWFPVFYFQFNYFEVQKLIYCRRVQQIVILAFTCMHSLMIVIDNCENRHCRSKSTRRVCGYKRIKDTVVLNLLI